MKDKKVMAAVLAAVAAYMEEEKTPLAARPSLWVISGREEIMRMRGLWQWRRPLGRGTGLSGVSRLH